MKRTISVLAIFLLTTFLPAEEILTVAESSDYTKTSLYDDVMNFLYQVQRKSDRVRILPLATSSEGRMVPLVVLSTDKVERPGDLATCGKPAVLIMANIHAGEVEGKEASLMLIRDIALGRFAGLLDTQVLLFIPVFNPDGNDKLGHNRRDLGPELAGVRFNGQNLDLNRDYMKLESTEVSALVGLFNSWDPVLTVDMHTTNGSYHREPVTYSTQISPNCDKALSGYMWQKFFPFVARTLKTVYGYDSVPFGDFVEDEFPEKGWISDAVEARYGQNYVGLRNRFSVLNENYSYADFKTRVLGCFSFLRAILDYCEERREEIRGLVRDADERTVRAGNAPTAADGFALEVEVKPLPEKITVRGYEMEIIPREGTWPEIKKTDKEKTYVLPYFADYVPKRTVRRPYAYLVAPADPDVVAALRRHGLAVERLTAPARLDAEAFKITALKAAARPYQGHWTSDIKGDYLPETRTFEPGTLVVRTGQPLGRLACYLLEPASDDGLFYWNAFDRYLVPQWGRGFETCPVFRLVESAALETEPKN